MQCPPKKKKKKPTTHCIPCLSVSNLDNSQAGTPKEMGNVLTQPDYHCKGVGVCFRNRDKEFSAIRCTCQKKKERKRNFDQYVHVAIIPGI